MDVFSLMGSSSHGNNVTGLNSPGAKLGTWKSLRVQGFMIDLESIGVLKELSLVATTATLGKFFYLNNS